MIDYHKDKPRIVNTEQLPRGLNCRYLMVMPSHIPGEYIAIHWCRKLPRTIPLSRDVVDFGGPKG